MKKFLMTIILLLFLSGCVPQPSNEMVFDALTRATWLRGPTGDIWGYMKVSGNVYRWGFINALTQKTSYSGPMLWTEINTYLNFYKSAGYQYVTIYQVDPVLMSAIIGAIQRIIPSAIWFVIVPGVWKFQPTPVPSNFIYPAP
jgi:hypothetical protein